MNRRLRTLCHVVVASLLFAFGRVAWGQEPPAAAPLPPIPAIPEHASAVPANHAVDASVDAAPKERYRLFPRQAETRPIRTATQDSLHRHGLGCFATIDTLGCTSLHSELTFIFGSCRAFFGEPCLPRPDGTYGLGCGATGCR